MANFLNYIVESTIQPVKTNVLWIKNGVPYYYNKRWKPLLGAGGGVIDSPIDYGEGWYSVILKDSNTKALNERNIALGFNLTTYNLNETAFGRYNKSTESTDSTKASLFTIGNGSASNLSNAFEVKQNGDIYIQGIEESLQDYLSSFSNYDEDIKQLNDKISLTEESLNVKFEELKVDVDGTIGEYSSSFTQTAEEIRAEVASVKTTLEGQIEENKASLSITAEAIRTEVSQIKTDLEGKIEENTSSITQTAEEIQLLVQKNTEIGDKVTTLESSITQTAEEIVLLVGRIDDVEGDITTLSSSITQTAESITLEVNAIKEDLEGKIEANTSLIQQTSDNITLLVNNSIENLNNKDAELEGLIASNTASIEINADAIASKVSQETFDVYKGEVTTQFTEVNQTIEGITTTIAGIDGTITEIKETTDGLGVRLGTAEADIESLKKQSDGSIETHFGTVAPTLDNEPAVNWTTDEEKYEHTGDLYYNNATGEAYRFSYNPETGLYFWVELTDSALTDALDKISKLESAIDGKVTIFYTTPTNYKYGDIWFVHADNESFKEGTLVSATNIDKNTIRETLVLSDWVEKTNYVDTESLTEEVTNLNNYIDNAFKDGVLSEAEIAHIQELKKNFELAYKELNELYSLLIITVFATEEEETSLVNAKSTLDTAYNALISAIDNLNTNVDESGVNQSLQVYENAYQAYLDALQEYSRIASLIQEGAESELLKPYDYIKNIASDGFITPIEKKQLLEIWKSISEEFTSNRSIAVNYKIIHLVNGEYVQRTDIFEDSSYYNIYNTYASAYNNIANIFTEDDPFGFKNLEETTDLSEKTITSLQEIEELFSVYYTTLGDFSEMISKITIDITDAHQVVIDLANSLVEQLDPREAITQIGKGVVLSSVIGVKDIDGKLEAVLNGSDSISEAENTEHGKIVFAGGIDGASDWNNATTVIYEDGHVVMKSGEIGEYVEIGNALVTAVSSGKIDLFSYPQTVDGVTTLIPLFQINKDDTGKIISISSVFDFIGNKNIWALEQVSSGGIAEEGSGDSTGVILLEEWANYDETLSQALGANLGIELNQRVAALESGSMTPDLEGYATEEYVDTKVLNVNSSLAVIDNRVTANSSVIETLQSDVDGINSTLTDIDNRVSENTSAIESLQETDSDLNKRLEDVESWFELSGDTLITKYNIASDGQVSSGGVADDGTGSGGAGIIVDAEMSSESDNPVSNRVIKEYVDSSIEELSSSIKEFPDTFISLKTINGNTLYGSGDIEIISEITNDMIEDALGYTPLKPEDLNATTANLEALQESFNILNASLTTNESSEIDTWDEVVAFLNGIGDTNTLSNIIDGKANQEDLDDAIKRIEVFESWFKKDSDGNIYTEENFYSTGQLSSGGIAEEGSGEGEGSGSISGASDASISDQQDGDIIVWQESTEKWVNKRGMYHHVQSTPLQVWEIQHNMGKFPNVKIVDSSKQLCMADVYYVDENNVKIEFGSTQSGSAYLD